jgi:subtilisin family serine protease
VAEPQIKEQNIIEDRFPFAALIMPREPEPEENVTFTPAAVRRSLFGQDLELRTPSKNVANTLRHVGLEDVEKLQAVRQSASDAGVFTRLGSLGMTAAFFGDERHEANAKEELADQYEFVPNFSLTLPPPVKLEDAPTARGQGALDVCEWPAESGVARAHEVGIRGAGVLCGVVDSGIDAGHPEFSHRTTPFRYVSLEPDSPYAPARDIFGFDPDGHGSHVSGIIAGRNVGVAPEASLYVASVIESETARTSMIRVAYGLDWMFRQFTRPETEHRPAVLNMSLGFPTALVDHDIITREEFEMRVLIMRRVLRALIQANVMPLIAIGNEGEETYRYPGAFDDVVGVGAVDFDGKVADFSGSGQPEQNPKPDFVGYGVSVYSSLERDYEGNPIYERMSGTSMATPYATGIAALYRCQQPTLTVKQVWDRLLDTTLELPGEKGNRVGAGLVRFTS